MDDTVRLIATTTHGRILVRATAARASGLLVGFHGYQENATIQMQRLATIPGADGWTLVAVQGLHRFYRGRTDEVIASWMTREDREAMIEDNIAYVDAAVESVDSRSSFPIVCVGFSQGVAMAFRAAVRGRATAAGVVAVGGDVPPELVADTSTRFPPVLLVRGQRDNWYTQAKLDADVAALLARGVAVTAIVVDGGHEWNDAVADAAGRFIAGL
jgi:predicted esterase